MYQWLDRAPKGRNETGMCGAATTSTQGLSEVVVVRARLEEESHADRNHRRWSQLEAHCAPLAKRGHQVRLRTREDREPAALAAEIGGRPFLCRRRQHRRDRDHSIQEGRRDFRGSICKRAEHVVVIDIELPPELRDGRHRCDRRGMLDSQWSARLGRPDQGVQQHLAEPSREGRSEGTTGG